MAHINSTAHHKKHFSNLTKKNRYNSDSFTLVSSCYVGWCHFFFFEDLRKKRSVPLTKYRVLHVLKILEAHRCALAHWLKTSALENGNKFHHNWTKWCVCVCVHLSTFITGAWVAGFELSLRGKVRKFSRQQVPASHPTETSLWAKNKRHINQLTFSVIYFRYKSTEEKHK